MAITGQFRKIAEQNPSEFDPRKFLAPSMDAMTALCRQRYEDFGAAGRASGIGPVHSLDAMAKRYRSDQLVRSTS